MLTISALFWVYSAVAMQEKAAKRLSALADLKGAAEKEQKAKDFAAS